YSEHRFDDTSQLWDQQAHEVARTVQDRLDYQQKLEEARSRAEDRFTTEANEHWVALSEEGRNRGLNEYLDKGTEAHHQAYGDLLKSEPTKTDPTGNESSGGEPARNEPASTSSTGGDQTRSEPPGSGPARNEPATNTPAGGDQTKSRPTGGDSTKGGPTGSEGKGGT